jgi:sphingomyelin phosphodiesterase acid-like 3
MRGDAGTVFFFFFFFLPLLLLVQGAPPPQHGFFFHFSDAHLDPDYLVRGDPIDRCVNRTGIVKNGFAGPWGDYACDSQIKTFQALLEAMVAINPNPEWIFWTGDSVPHWLDYTSVQFYSVSLFG